MIIGLSIIAIGVLTGIFSEFLEENKTLRSFYISNFIKEIGMILGVILSLVGIIYISTACYYYFYRGEIVSFYKIILSLFLLFSGLFLVELNFYSIIDLDLIRFAFSNNEKLKIDIEILKSKGFIPKKEVNLQTRINDTIFNIKKNKDGDIEIIAILSSKLNLDTQFVLIKFYSTGISLFKPSDEIKEIFSILIKEYGENFLFVEEKGFKSIKTISSDQICATFACKDYDKMLYNFLMQFSRFIELIKIKI